MKQKHIVPKDEKYILSDINIGDELKDENTHIKGVVTEITKHQNSECYYYKFYLSCDSFIKGVKEQKIITYTRFYN